MLLKLLTVTSKAVFMLPRGLEPHIRRLANKWMATGIYVKIATIATLLAEARNSIRGKKMTCNVLARPSQGKQALCTFWWTFPSPARLGTSWDMCKSQCIAPSCLPSSVRFEPGRDGNLERFLTHKSDRPYQYLPLHPHIQLFECLLPVRCLFVQNFCFAVVGVKLKDAPQKSKFPRQQTMRRWNSRSAGHILGGRLNVSNAFCIFVQAKCSLCPAEERLFSKTLDPPTCRTNKTSRLPFGFRSHPSAHCCNTYRICLAPSELNIQLLQVDVF